MNDLKMVIKSCLLRLNIDPTHKGFSQLLECVFVCAVERYIRIGDIYAVVADKYGIQPDSVSRNITYALNHVNDFPSRLIELLNIKIDVNALHNGMIITYLADFVTEPKLFRLMA